MKIIKNRFIPFGHYQAINLFGLVFSKKKLDDVERNHEFIHTLQQRELLFIGFYLLYLTEWIIRLAITRNFNKAYYTLSFEKEAYANQKNLEYKKNRRHFAWRLYI